MGYCGAIKANMKVGVENSSIIRLRRLIGFDTKQLPSASNKGGEGFHDSMIPTAIEDKVPVGLDLLKDSKLPSVHDKG